MPASKQAEPPTLEGTSRATDAAIYVHWPFCAKKCPYCDFNSHVREKVDQNAWQNAMLREVETFAAKFPNLKATSIFFGGGTPSLMPPETTGAIIEAVKRFWAPDQPIEITLEANPSSVEAARFSEYAAAGVNRVSIGVQSFKDTSLKFLGRLHSAGDAERALKVARDNFSRVSFDLIYALPQQSLEDWRTELQHALAFSPSHLSLYQLTIEEGTAFYHQFHRGKFTLPDEDDAAALFELTQEMTAEAGLPAYEISNHARPGEQSRHNLAYWRGHPYVGIGPGAHGRLPSDQWGRVAHQQIKRPEDWLKMVEETGAGVAFAEEVYAHDHALERVMMGLRLTEGTDISGLEGSVIDVSALNDLTVSGHIDRAGGRIMLTRKGRPLLNFILQKLLV